MADGRWRRLALPLFGNVMQSIVWTVFLGVLLPSYAALHGHTDRYGTMVAVNAAAIALFAIPGGRLSDIAGRR
ncbi:MAG: MFS transporter, partial [Thermoplasmata archaeon]|nr:MFS transporter [Thermoplasmata archaeon]